MGRPPGPRERRRRNRVVTFVTDAELEALQRLSDRSGRSLSAEVHAILTGSLRKGAKG
ncbi:MAG: hypothetical protein PVF68_06250 [Acidobacteriota bacterium]|jgi:hypothetical protein